MNARLLRWLLPFALVAMLCQCSSTRIRIQKPVIGETSWRAADGKDLPFRQWPERGRLPANPEALIICVHGLSGAASDFWALGEEFGKRGSVIYGIELRGQGNDPNSSKRGTIRSADEWIGDLYAFTDLVRARHPGVPVVWYGESLGGLISLHALARDDQKRADGLIMSSPVTAIRHDVPGWKMALARGAMLIAPGYRLSLEQLGGDAAKRGRVTSTTTHREQMERTPHYVEKHTLRVFREIDRMMRGSHAAAAKVGTPALILYTPNDVVTSREQIQAFFKALGSEKKEKRFFPESYHLLLHDKDREEALKIVGTWMRKTLP